MGKFAAVGAKLLDPKPVFSPSGGSGGAGENSERRLAWAASALSVEVLKGLGGSGGTLNEADGAPINLEAAGLSTAFR